MKSLSRTREPDFAKGLFAGIAAGLLASFLMEQFQALWTEAAEELKPSKGKEKSSAQEEPATVKLAQAVSKGLTSKQIPARKKAAAGEAVHYTMGAASGAIYGVAAELTSLATMADGMAFGATVWLTADNAVLPALGFAKPLTQIPASTHVYALASHLVYGFVTETVRRAFRGAL